MRLLVLMLVACGQRAAEVPVAELGGSSSSAESSERSPSAPADTPLDPAEPPEITLGVDSDSLVLRVTDAQAELRRQVRVQRRDGDGWAETDAMYRLGLDCEAPTGGCVSLVAGAELVSPPLTPEGQCNSSALAPGDYRLVVESCASDGTRPHERHVEISVAP